MIEYEIRVRRCRVPGDAEHWDWWVSSIEDEGRLDGQWHLEESGSADKQSAAYRQATDWLLDEA